MPRSVDLSGVQLTPTGAAILSDVFNIEWGLCELALRECNLDDSVCPSCSRSRSRRPLTSRQKLKPVRWNKDEKTTYGVTADCI